jgi:integrase
LQSTRQQASSYRRCVAKRDRVASPREAERLLEALPESDRALWASALDAGLRRGELQALDWMSVDMKSGVIRVERSWDDKERLFIEPKSSAGRRAVPIPAVFRTYLIEHGSGQADQWGSCSAYHQTSHSHRLRSGGAHILHGRRPNSRRSAFMRRAIPLRRS